MEVNKAEKIALELMTQHGLRDWNHLERFWSFKWDNARKRFGLCSYRTKTISLSRPLVLLNSEEQVRDTILHEIAHALAPLGAHHGRLWQVQALAIGARPVACCAADTVLPRGKWTAVCSSCGTEHHAYRPLKRRKACGKCCRAYAGGRFDVRFELIYTTNGAQQNAI